MQNLLIFYLAIAHHISLITNPNFRQLLTFSNTLSSISSISEKKWTKIGQENVILDCFSSEQNQIFCISSNGTDKSINVFEKFKLLLYLYGPNKKLSNRKFKLTSKPWSTAISSFENTISTKNKYLLKFIKLKKPHIRTKALNKSILYKNLMSTNYFNKQSNHVL